MKTLCFASAVVASALFLMPAVAGELVPGSDHYVEATADAATHSVATGVRLPVVTSSITETRSFGYPEATPAAGGLPDARSRTHARDGTARAAVSRGMARDSDND